MFKIVEKRDIAPKVSLFKVEAPKIAKKRKAGQFIILRIDENGERIPLTIADSDNEKGTITIIAQEVGKTTAQLNSLKVGDYLMDVAGPLGLSTHIEKFGNGVCVGGGIGIAVTLPIAKALKEAGNNTISIIGARTKDLLILEEEMRAASTELIVCTDDGSYANKGFVTDELKKLIDSGLKIDYLVAIGPLPMMRAVCNTTKPYNLKTYVSLNPIMVDGTGMCGACRVTVGGITKFVCVDGPEFDGHLVDFDELAKRQRSYIEYEKKAFELYKQKHAGGCCGEGGKKWAQM